MGEQKPEKVKKHICTGLLAHVDAGKTTLSEALLYTSGRIRRLGRVDRGDATWIPMSWKKRGASPSSPSRQSWPGII